MDWWSLKFNQKLNKFLVIAEKKPAFQRDTNKSPVQSSLLGWWLSDSKSGRILVVTCGKGPAFKKTPSKVFGPDH